MKKSIWFTMFVISVLAISASLMLGCDPLDPGEDNDNNTTIQVNNGGSVILVDDESQLSQDQIEGKTRYNYGNKIVYE